METMEEADAVAPEGRGGAQGAPGDSRFAIRD